MIFPDNKHFSNISLIGMAGAGKSTLGPLLAKRLHYGFLDTDDLIADIHDLRLQAIIDMLGQEEFRKLEEQVVSTVHVHSHVIATGGSAVYSGSAMQHLHRIGTVIWLDVPLQELERRVINADTRVLVNPQGSSFAALHEQRYALYRDSADVHIICHDREPAELVEIIVRQLEDE